MCPIVHAQHINYSAIAAAVVASFVFGFLWYGPLFGKQWAQLMGKKMEDCKDKKPEGSALLLTLLGTTLTTFVLAYILQNIKPYCNFGAALFIWLGFYIPLLLGSVTWEGRPWKLFFLNAVYYLLNLQLISAILTYLR